MTLQRRPVRNQSRSVKVVSGIRFSLILLYSVCVSARARVCVFWGDIIRRVPHTETTGDSSLLAFTR